jgi:hypothetical protein
MTDPTAPAGAPAMPVLKSSQAAIDLISAERLREVLTYCPSTGAWTWRVNPPKKRTFIGKPAGCRDDKGYLIIKIDGKPYRASRLAHLYMTGGWPEKLVDHRDTTRSNDRWDNLRPATYSQNNINANQPIGRSGLRGAAWSERVQKWKSSIRAQGKRQHLGYFDCPAAAHFSYLVASNIHHREFARIA